MRRAIPFPAKRSTTLKSDDVLLFGRCTMQGKEQTMKAVMTGANQPWEVREVPAS